MYSDYLLPIAVVAFIAWRAWSTWSVRQKVPELLRAGAQIVDVRSPVEFASGHAPQSRNIPLSEIANRSNELDPTKWVIVCCASGSRSAIARRLLLRKGFRQVLNAGSWKALR